RLPSSASLSGAGPSSGAGWVVVAGPFPVRLMSAPIGTKVLWPRRQEGARPAGRLVYGASQRAASPRLLGAVNRPPTGSRVGRACDGRRAGPPSAPQEA